MTHMTFNAASRFRAKLVEDRAIAAVLKTTAARVGVFTLEPPL